MKGTTRSIAMPRGKTRWFLSANAVLVYVFFYAPIALLVISICSFRQNSRSDYFTACT